MSNRRPTRPAVGRPRRRPRVETLERRLLLTGKADVIPLAAGDVYWQAVDQLPSAPADAQSYIKPTRFEAFTLDHDLMRKRLSTAPLEFTSAAETSSAMLFVPRPDGSLQRFAIVEAPIMEDALGDEFPEIRTYRGQGLDNSADTIRLDLTPAGFHAQVLSPTGAYYVDPYWHLDTSLYVSYFASDFVQRDTMMLHEPQDDFARLHSQAKSSSVSDDQLDAEQPDAVELSVRNKGPQARSGAQLRTYRLANAATGQYTAFHGGTVAGAMAGIATTINRVVGIYEVELAIRMRLVTNNSSIVYTNGSTDPYTNSDEFEMLDENQRNLDRVIGNNNYDIGHVFGTGGGGVADLAVVGVTGWKAHGATGNPTPVGDPFDIDYVTHEMGHQFGAEHTFNGMRGACDFNRNPSTAYEPGSGSTIMSYAGLCGGDDLQDAADPYFLFDSYDAIRDFVTTPGDADGVVTPTGNSEPQVNGGSDYTIPARTPFALTATASDADAGDTLTYSWEQRDLGPAQRVDSTDNGSSPLFRSWPPSLEPTRYFPRLTSLLNGSTLVGEQLPTTSRALDFRVTVRDNRSGGGGVDSDNVRVTVVDTGQPFRVTSPNTRVTWPGGSSQLVTWNVAGTDANGIGATAVNILLSLDGGSTFPHLLAENTSNDGSHTITVPPLSQSSLARLKVQGAGNIFFDISDANFTISSPQFTLDFGDAPDDGVTYAYGTRLPTGARHTLGFPILGSGVDGEADGQPGQLADGDGLDDDGIRLLSPLVRGTTAAIQVTSSDGGGQLDYFFDFDGDGRFGNDPGEIFSASLAGGVESLSLDVPDDAAIGTTFARFRISTAGGLSWNGAAADGEVEDYSFTIHDSLPEMDFGDAPAGQYATTLASNGARHTVTGPRLGALNTGEADAASNSIATGDTSDDGISLTELLVTGSQSNVQVTSSAGGGVLDYFFDFDRDGVFGNLANEVFRAQLSGGTELVPVAVPASARLGTTYARFRISGGGGLPATGWADSGEVEDYRVVILPAPGLACQPWQFFDEVSPPSLPAGWVSIGPNGWTTISGDADTPPNQVFAPNPDSVSDARLRSPTFIIDSFRSQLRFRSDYFLEEEFDGGVLEISIAGAPYQDILTAGGVFLEGGYDGQLSEDWGNPLGGRDAWTGDSGDWQDTIVNLPVSTTPQSARVQWRLGADESVDELGWWVDTIELCGQSDFLYDYGDALGAGFATLLDDDGARHVIGGPRLGTFVDADDDGQPNSDASGDDGDGIISDEDGVVFRTPVVAGKFAEVDVTVTSSSVLNAWLDFTGDHDWRDPGERIFQDVLLHAGLNRLAVLVPADAQPSERAFARFRLSSQPGLSFDGVAPDGEVEDHVVVIAAPPPQVLSIQLNDQMQDPPDLPTQPAPTSWQDQRSDLRDIRIEFTQPVVVTADDLELINLGVRASAGSETKVPISPEQLTVSANVVWLTFAAYELDDGVYQLTIEPSVVDLAGQPLDGNGDGTGGDALVYVGSADNRFYKLSGDFTGDQGVSIFDFPTFSYWFGRPLGVAPDYVDLNADGGVTIFDFDVYAGNFNAMIEFAPALVAPFVPFELVVAAGREQAAPDPGVEQAALQAIAIVKQPPPTRRLQKAPLASDRRQDMADEGERELQRILDDIAADVLRAW